MTMTREGGAANARPTLTHGPRVAHVTTVAMSLRYLLLNQLLYVRDAGYEVAAVSAPGDDVRTLTDHGLSHHAIGLNRRMFTPLRDLRAFWQLYRLFRRERFDIVHTHNPKPGFWGQLAARAAGTPVVVNTLHGFYFHDETPLWLRRAFIFIERIAARCSDIVLSQNPEDVDTAVHERICPPERIVVLGNGIDLRRFDPARCSPGTRERVRTELGIAAGAPVVGFVGRLVREKGLTEMLEAARIVREAVPDVRFLFVGPVDAHKSDAFDPANDAAGLSDLCVFTGLRHDLPELYAAMDVFALPSHREGFPRAPMEAAAMGLPCVLTDIRGCRQVVEPGATGFLVPVRDPAALAGRIHTLVQDEGLRKRMGARARRRAASRFDERDVFDTVVRHYRELLSRTGVAVPPAQHASSRRVEVTNGQM